MRADKLRLKIVQKLCVPLGVQRWDIVQENSKIPHADRPELLALGGQLGKILSVAAA